MRKEVEVRMSDVVEATPIAHLVQLANQYSSIIYLEKDNVKVNAKSIMGMMSLVISQGSRIVVDAQGDDCEAAVAALEDFLSK